MPRRRMTPQEMQDRIDTFAELAADLISESERSYKVLYYHHQLVRSSGSSGAHYAEARAAATPRQFQQKLYGCLQELNESASWLRKLGRAIRQPLIELRKECDELCAMVFSSIRTSKESENNRRKKKAPPRKKGKAKKGKVDDQTSQPEEK